MLDSHPELAVPPETAFVVQFIRAAGRLRFGPETATKAIVEDRHRRWGDFGLEPAQLLERFRGLEPFNAADALRCFYELYCERLGKRRWGDKTPGYLIHMRLIQDALPEARFIHMIRDGRDAGLSQNARRARRGGRTMPARELAPRWRKRILDARAAAAELSGYLEIRFEDLVADPEPALRRACALIELDYDPAMLDYHERAEERLEEAAAVPASRGRPEREAGERVAAHAMTRRPPSQERVAVWKREMSEAENTEFEDMAGDLLAELGYEIAGLHQG
jgi:hypothetical protein